MDQKFSAIRWQGDGPHSSFHLIDQTKLPGSLEWRVCRSADELIDAIQILAIRGAPLLGIAGAYGVTLVAIEALRSRQSRTWFEERCERLARCRPTAVNLAWGVKSALSEIEGRDIDEKTVELLLDHARGLEAADRKGNEVMAGFGAELFPESSHSAMTICNTGELCTGGVGTAFGVLRRGVRTGRLKHIYACETRPLLQGLRLTAWELKRENIPYTLICDSMSATVMRDGRVAGVVVGADRIVANGDFANKIGTYTLAVVARHHGVPFYVAAPSSSFDISLENGGFIQIEERKGSEITEHPFNVFNPAFDVTPAELVTAIICEKGVIHSPNRQKVLECLK